MFIDRIDGVQYLSSNSCVQNFFDIRKFSNFSDVYKRQGPSMEHQSFRLMKGMGIQISDDAQGIDFVPSIHCDFWPIEASEWAKRQRQFDWPSSSTLSSIKGFGFHLVPVGHPHSETKLTEWRISFSVAERILVWSFNHIQMQLYAVMKIILKQFIKTKCSQQNQVLCSYFIKTFLFWKFETTDMQFWREDNFGECFKFLITEFAQCLHDGVLRHYFIPRFILLSVKLTREAQNELVSVVLILLFSMT